MIQYQVTGACAHATVDGPSGRVRQLHFKGTLLPADVPQVEIDHLLSVGLIKAVGVRPTPTAPADQPATGTPAEGTEPDPGEGETEEPELDDPEADQSPAEDPEVEARRAEARPKLPADGSKPDGRMGQPVWVEYLVSKGYDYAAVAKAEKKELVELASQLNQ